MRIETLIKVTTGAGLPHFQSTKRNRLRWPLCSTVEAGQAAVLTVVSTNWGFPIKQILCPGEAQASKHQTSHHRQLLHQTPTTSPEGVLLGKVPSEWPNLLANSRGSPLGVFHSRRRYHETTLLSGSFIYL